MTADAGPADRQTGHGTDPGTDPGPEAALRVQDT